MLLTEQSSLGGRPNKTNRFPLAQDKQGNLGLRLGYIEGEPILIKLYDAEKFANTFGYTTKSFWRRIGEWI